MTTAQANRSKGLAAFPVRGQSLPSGAFTRRMARFLRSSTSETVSLGEMIDALGATDRTALLLVPALLAFSPATIVFGVATVCGLAMALIGLQLLLSKRGVWLPSFMRALSIRRSLLISAVNRLQPALEWLETFCKPRLVILVSGPTAVLPILMIVLLGLALPLLELVPLSATSGGLAVSLIALGMVMRDGLLTLLGMLIWCGVALLAGIFATQALTLLEALWSFVF